MQLRIHSISELNFGKHQGASFKDLDHDFVVFYGLNESGKSTIAEYLTWTIGGPWRSAKDGSDRFRSSINDQVSGRLVGALGGDPLDIEAKFKILRSGNPNDLRIGTNGQRSYTGGEFVTLFKGLTPEDFRWIYRLYGVELGKIGTAEELQALFSSFTMGNASNTVNPREKATALASKVKQLAAKIKNERKAVSDLQSEIKEAKKAPDDINALRDKLSKIKEDLATLDLEMDQRRSQKALTSSAIEGLKLLDEQQRVEKQLELLGNVPTDWEKILPSANELRSLHSDAETIRRNLDAAREDAARALARLGMPLDTLIGQTLSATERQHLHSASAEVGRCEELVSDADAAIADIASKVSGLEIDLDSRAKSVGLSDDRLNALAEQGHIVSGLQGPAALWLQASEDTTSSEGTLAGAEAYLNAAETQSDTPQSTTKRNISFLLMICALLLVGALSLINPILSVISAVASAVAFLVMSKKRSVGQPTYLDQAARVREAQNKVAEAQSDLATIKDKRDKAANRVIEPLTQIGSTIPTAQIAEAHLEQLAHLAQKVTEFTELNYRFSKAKIEASDAREELVTAQIALRDLLHGRGIESIPETAHFPDWLSNYEDAINATELRERVGVKYSDINESIKLYLTPIEAEIKDLRWTQIAQQLADYEELDGEIRSSEQKLNECRIAVSAGGMDQPEITELLARYSSSEALVERVEALRNEIRNLGDARDAKIERRTEIDGEVSKIEDTEVLPSLQLKLGETEEALEDLEKDHKAHNVASTILEKVIERFERENQDPLVQEAQQIINRVVPAWGSLMYSRDANGKVVIERDGAGGKLIDNRISDGGRALLYLAIRLAFASRDADTRGIRFPLICDDPFIHFDDERTAASIDIFKSISEQHQVILFTCEEGTRDLAEARGAKVIEI